MTVSGTGFVSGNSLAFTVYPPATISLSQAFAKQGETLQVVITGSYTTFPANYTKAKFGPGISVGGAAEGQIGPVTVLSDTTVRADLFINPDAAAGARDVEVIGLDDINLIGGFSVNAATTLTVTDVSPSQPWANWPSDYHSEWLPEQWICARSHRAIFSFGCRWNSFLHDRQHFGHGCHARPELDLAFGCSTGLICCPSLRGRIPYGRALQSANHLPSSCLGNGHAIHSYLAGWTNTAVHGYGH